MEYKLYFTHAVNVLIAHLVSAAKAIVVIVTVVEQMEVRGGQRNGRPGCHGDWRLTNLEATLVLQLLADSRRFSRDLLGRIFLGVFQGEGEIWGGPHSEILKQFPCG